MFVWILSIFKFLNVLSFLKKFKIDSILPSIKKHWKIVIVLAIFAGGFFYWQFLTHKIDKLEQRVLDQTQQVASLELQLLTSETNFTTLKSSLDTQNETIGKINDMIKQNQTDWKQLYTDINKQNDQLNQRLRDILKEDKPGTCQEAISYLLDARKGFSK